MMNRSFRAPLGRCAMAVSLSTEDDLGYSFRISTTSGDTTRGCPTGRTRCAARLRYRSETRGPSPCVEPSPSYRQCQEG
jgi:hypothetical protein